MILLFVTDGREYFFKTLESALAHLEDISCIVVNDDSANPAFRKRVIHALANCKYMFRISDALPEKSGFGCAVNNAWKICSELDGDDFVFHLEDDFIFNQHIPIQNMKRLLNEDQNIVQIALKRQPWSQEEIKAGCLMKLRGTENFVNKTNEYISWTEHRQFFTTNPCLIRKSLCSGGFPTCNYSESAFTGKVFSDVNAKCAFLLHRDSAPTVHHIGSVRTGINY